MKKHKNTSQYGIGHCGGTPPPYVEEIQKANEESYLKPVCGINCGCKTGEDCYGEAALNLINKDCSPSPVDESVEERAERLYPVEFALHHGESFRNIPNWDMNEDARKAYIAGATDQLNECLKEHVRLEGEISNLKKSIEYALGLLTNVEPMHRKEMTVTAKATLRKALNQPNTKSL